MYANRCLSVLFGREPVQCTWYSTSTWYLHWTSKPCCIGFSTRTSIARTVVQISSISVLSLISREAFSVKADIPNPDRSKHIRHQWHDTSHMCTFVLTNLVFIYLIKFMIFDTYHASRKGMLYSTVELHNGVWTLYSTIMNEDLVTGTYHNTGSVVWSTRSMLLSRISDYCMLRVAVQTGLLWLHITHDRQSCGILRIWKIRSKTYTRDS